MPLVHVSTAYVCGRRSGTIAENELDTGQEFSNGYERSKCRAEQLVNQAPVGSVILRPAIVAGEAATGAIRDYKNLYTLVKLIVEGKLRRLPGRYDATLSLVPVDYVADAVVAATELVHAGDASILGRTFHLQGANTLSLREVSDVLAEYPSFEVGTFVPPTAFSVEDLDPIERDYYERIGAQYTCYFDRIRTFDDTNTRTLLGLVPPATGVDYLRSLLDFCLASGYLGRPLPSISEILANELSRSPGPIRRQLESFTESDLTAEFFTELLREQTGDTKVEVTAATRTGSAVRGTLSAVVQAANPGRFIGVAPLRLEFANRPAVDVMVKSKPLDSEITTTLAAVMSMAGGDITDAWLSCTDASHFIDLNRREIGLYRDAPDAVKAITPRCFGTYENAEQGVLRGGARASRRQRGVSRRRRHAGSLDHRTARNGDHRHHRRARALAGPRGRAARSRLVGRLRRRDARDAPVVARHVRPVPDRLSAVGRRRHLQPGNRGDRRDLEVVGGTGCDAENAGAQRLQHAQHSAA